MQEAVDIMALSAHPDDMDMEAGGTMAAAAANGGHAVHVIATAGEDGSLDPVRYPPQTMGPVRMDEQFKASAILGVRETLFMGYPDGNMSAVLRPLENVGQFDDAYSPVREQLGRHDPIDRIRRLLVTYQPKQLISYGPGGRTGHPDHAELAWWVMTALLEEQAEGNLRDTKLLGVAETVEWVQDIWPILNQAADGTYGEPPSPVPDSALAVDRILDGWLLDLKLEALLAGHRSQFELLVERIGMDTLVKWARRESLVRWV